MTEVRHSSFDADDIDTPVPKASMPTASISTTVPKVTGGISSKKVKLNLKSKNKTSGSLKKKKKRNSGKKKLTLGRTPPASPKIEPEQRPSMVVAEAPPDIFGVRRIDWIPFSWVFLVSLPSILFIF